MRAADTASINMQCTREGVTDREEEREGQREGEAGAGSVCMTKFCITNATSQKHPLIHVSTYNTHK